MRAAIEYYRDGERVTVHFETARAELPVKTRGSSVTFIRWGTRRDRYLVDDNTPGHLLKFPVDGCATFESIKSGKYEPRPVRIVASAFLDLDGHLIPRRFPLKPGEFIQGLVAHVRSERRIYVVTVPAPREHAEHWERWPRILTAGAFR